MANIKISNITTYTGNPEDVRWFVMNNSGNTETFKFSGYTSPYKYGTGADSVVSGYLPQSHAPGQYQIVMGSHSSASAGNYSVNIGGQNNIAADTLSAVIGGQQNICGFRSFIGSGMLNNVSGGQNGCFGYNNLIANGSGSLVGGSDNKVFGGNDQGYFSTGYLNVITSNGGIGIFSIGGQQNKIQNFSSTGDLRWNLGGVLGGRSNYIGNNRSNPDNTTAGQNAFPLILGGYYNTILSDAIGVGNNFTNWYSSIYNSDNSTISGGTTGGTIINSSNSTLSGARRSNIIGSVDSAVAASADTTSIISSVDTIITGVTSERVLMLGTSGRTEAFSETTHVENIHTFKTETFSVIDGGNVGGTTDVDCSLGTIFTFTMTADTTPNFINLRKGQRFIFIVNNTTFNVPTATINGVGGNVFAKNGSISPSNNAISKYTATYDGTRLFLDEELNFSAV